MCRIAKAINYLGQVIQDRESDGLHLPLHKINKLPHLSTKK